MDVGRFVEDSAAVATAELVGMILGLGIAVLLGVLWIRSTRAPAGLAWWAVALPAAIGAGWGAVVLSNPGTSLEPVRATVHSVLGAWVFALFYAVVPAGALLVTSAIAGVRRGPRRWWVGGVGGALALTAAGLPLAGAYATHEAFVPLAALRTVIYVVAAIAVAIALVGGDPEGSPGPEAGAGAGVGFAALVGIGEASGDATARWLMLKGLGRAPLELRAEYLDKLDAEMFGPIAVWTWLAIGLAVAVALFGVAMACRDRRRTIGAVTGGVFALLTPVLYATSGVNGATWVALSEVLPERAPGNAEDPPVNPTDESE